MLGIYSTCPRKTWTTYPTLLWLSTESVDKWGYFYELSTFFVDKLNIFHTLIIICGISNETEYISMEKIWITRFKRVGFDAFSYMCDIL
nr:MAG TPA: hypothetical protein [Caudoviricetes sp.]